VVFDQALDAFEFSNVLDGGHIHEPSRQCRLDQDNDFADTFRHSELDTAFHTVMYQKNYNRHADELWWKHREVLRAVSRRFNFTLAR
ncbi:GntR family transcriptional regulator, partial [Rhizobium ruizarguesonis]